MGPRERRSVDNVTRRCAARASSSQSRPTGRSLIGTSGRRLLVSLTVDRVLALGSGVRGGRSRLRLSTMKARVTLIWTALPRSPTTGGRGSRRECSARRSGALPCPKPHWTRGRGHIMSQDMPRVVIGMDPHKRTATIEVMTADETSLVEASSPPTPTATPRCGTTAGNGPRGCGRWRAAKGSAGTSPNG